MFKLVRWKYNIQEPNIIVSARLLLYYHCASAAGMVWVFQKNAAAYQDPENGDGDGDWPVQQIFEPRIKFIFLIVSKKGRENPRV
jgi:hypothetical protein